MQKQKIQVIAVDQEDAVLLEDMLNDDYVIIASELNEDSISFIKKNEPDLILLDQDRAKTQIISLCIKLKMDAFTEKIPIMILSADSSLTDRLQGYEAGVASFVQKPIKHSDLRIKFQLALERESKIKQIQQESESAMALAMASSRYSGDNAIVINFYLKCFNIQTIGRLADVFLKVLQDMELSATVFIFSEGEELFLSNHTDEVSEQDKQEIQIKSDKEKIHSYGRKTIFNFRNFNLLVNNMKVEDEEQYGRIKDVIAMLGEGIDARVEALNYEQQLLGNSIHCKEILDRANMELAEIMENHEAQQKQSSELVDWLEQSIEESLVSLGLSVGQEDILMELMHHLQKKSFTLQNNKINLFKKMETLFDYLQESDVKPQLRSEQLIDDEDDILF